MPQPRQIDQLVYELYRLTDDAGVQERLAELG